MLIQERSLRWETKFDLIEKWGRNKTSHFHKLEIEFSRLRILSLSDDIKHYSPIIIFPSLEEGVRGCVMTLRKQLQKEVLDG